MTPLLAIRDLSVSFATDEGRVTALDGVSLTVARGRIVGLVGESGSGKSVTARSVLALAGANARVEGGSIVLHDPDGDGPDVDVTRLTRARDLRALRGGRVAMIFQEPMASFAPALTVGRQMVEAIRLHDDCSKAQAHARAVAALREVGMPEPERRMGAYAFELSGGQRQRAMIAMALSMRPDLLIADEPTTALDVTLQAQVIELIRRLAERHGMGVLFITHDLGVVSELTDRTVVMYLGQVVEDGPTADVIAHPLHPYTRALIEALPSIDDPDRPLVPVPGDIPGPLERPTGCAFRTRCSIAEPSCATRPPRIEMRPDHGCACHVVARSR